MAENPWTDDRVEWLTKLWAKGLSASIIGEQMKMTRNMVLGKVHRLELPAREPRVATGEAKKRKYPKTRAAATKGNAPRIKPELYVVSVADVTPLNITLMQLTASTCRYPYGDGPFTFCGCEVHPGKPYCPAHVELCAGNASARQMPAKKIPSPPPWRIKSNMRAFA